MLFLLCVCYAFVRVCLLSAGKGLTSWLSLGMSYCYFPIGILDQVWYLIASIPDLCLFRTLIGCIFSHHLPWNLSSPLVLKSSGLSSKVVRCSTLFAPKELNRVFLRYF